MWSSFSRCYEAGANGIIAVIKGFSNIQLFYWRSRLFLPDLNNKGYYEIFVPWTVHSLIMRKITNKMH
jgi:hypothetical protein